MLEPQGEFWQLLCLVIGEMWEEERLLIESAGAR